MIGWAAASLGVLVAALLYDLAYTRWMIAAGARRARTAALWSVLTYAIGLIGVASVLRGSLWLAIPEAIGLYLGTWIGIRRAPPP